MQISLTEASAELVHLVEAALKGEEVIITRDNKPVAKLAAVSSTKPRPKFGSARGLITISDDFDEPLEDFREYME